jgi:plasmid stabilization system protein ParE
MRYRLTEAAQQDVREITRHIRDVQRSPQNAKLVATPLKAAFAKLVEQPNLGHPRSELGDETHGWSSSAACWSSTTPRSNR